MTTHHYGTIRAREGDRLMLESLDVNVGSYDARAGHFIVRVDAAAYERLRDFASDYQPQLSARNSDCADRHLRPGMTLDDLQAERAYIDYMADAAASPAEALTWKVARNGVQAMVNAVNEAGGEPAKLALSGAKITSLMRQNNKTIRSLAKAMNIPIVRVQEVRTKGVRGEGYVLDWLEAIHKMEAQEYQENIAAARGSARYLVERIDLAWRHPRSPYENRATRDRRITEEIENRNRLHEAAYGNAKLNDLLVHGPDIAARLAELRKRDVTVLSPAESRRWAELEAREFVKLQGAEAREYAAIQIAENMKADAEFRVAFLEVNPELAATVAALNAQAEQRVADREAEKSKAAERIPDQYIITSYLPYAAAIPGTDMDEQQGGDTFWIQHRGWSYSTAEATRYSPEGAHAELSRLHQLGSRAAKLMEAPAPWLRPRPHRTDPTCSDMEM